MQKSVTWKRGGSQPQRICNQHVHHVWQNNGTQRCSALLQSSAHHCSHSWFIRLTQNICLGKSTKLNFTRGRQKEKKVNFYIFSNRASIDCALPTAEKAYSTYLLLRNSKPIYLHELFVNKQHSSGSHK